MEFTSYDLNFQTGGSVVIVELQGTEANVQLLDGANFSRYRQAQSYSGYGGHYRSSPVRLAVPHDGHWHVVIDLGGLAGTVRSTVQVLPAAA